MLTSDSHSAFGIRHSAFAQHGFTFVELLVVSTILLILASAIMPLAKVSIQREREAELHRALREMRTAIDKYKDAADVGAIAPFDLKAGTENYPPDLETLVNGVTKNNDATGVKLKFQSDGKALDGTKYKDW